MGYGGAVPQEWVDELAPHLSKSPNTGRVMAEQLCRDDTTRPLLVKLFAGGELSAVEKASLPASRAGGSIADHINTGTGGD